jgi:hypothetical protein
MGPPLGLGLSGLDPSYAQGPFILNNPLNGFAFLDFQSLSQGSWTNQVELALPFGPFNHLNFGQVSHGKHLLSNMLKGGDHSYMAMSIIFYPFYNFFTPPLTPRGGEIFGRICLINYGLLSNYVPKMFSQCPFFFSSMIPIFLWLYCLLALAILKTPNQANLAPKSSL